MRNPFSDIRDSGHGWALATAFTAGRDWGQVWSCIRLLRQLERLPEGCYLSGRHFIPWQTELTVSGAKVPSGDIDESDDTLEALKALAWAHVGECRKVNVR